MRLSRVAAPPTSRETLRAADAWCKAYARAHAENFTVVSWLLPHSLRPHFFALYAFCRATDDLGDEAAGDRLALLDAHERNVRACYDGQHEHPLFIALGRTIDECAIPMEPFLRLIEANRLDQRVQWFQTYEDLLGYCHYSATPVGEMVLHVLGYHDETRKQFSDATCIGLQLANFWQDVSVDLAKGRIYLPLDDLAEYGCSEDDLRRGRATPAFQRLMRFEVNRARELFAYGSKLEELIDGRARLDIALFRLGGQAVLDAIESADFDVLSRRPPISRATKTRLMATHLLRLLGTGRLEFMKGKTVR